MWQAVVLALGLAMDATAVCAARALAANSARERLILPLLFGAFQAGMSSLGWLGGDWATRNIASWDHWVAFGLLALIGAKMIFDAVRGGAEPQKPGSTLLYLGLAIATSIDAAAAGITLPLLAVPIWLALALIGGITFACALLGFSVGRALGERVGPRLGLVGGLVLIGIGIDVLIRAP